MRNIDRLLLAVVQVQDERKAIRALNQAGLSVTRLSSVGAFLGRRNVTLMIGLNRTGRDRCSLFMKAAARVQSPPLNTPLPIPRLPSLLAATVFTSKSALRAGRNIVAIVKKRQ
jgi:hypothetical protein